MTIYDWLVTHRTQYVWPQSRTVGSANILKQIGQETARSKPVDPVDIALLCKFNWLGTKLLVAWLNNITIVTFLGMVKQSILTQRTNILCHNQSDKMSRYPFCYQGCKITLHQWQLICISWKYRMRTKSECHQFTFWKYNNSKKGDARTTNLLKNPGLKLKEKEWSTFFKLEKRRASWPTLLARSLSVPLYYFFPCIEKYSQYPL